MTTINFHSTERSGIQCALSVWVNQFNEIFISIKAEDYEDSYVCLEKETAIKFSKELRKQISLLNENKNG